MNAEIKKRWVSALKSGEYKQGRARLNKNGGYCCLGVLCDLYCKETGIKWKPAAFTDGLSIFDEINYLPVQIAEWAGLDNRDPLVDERRLSYINDDNIPFEVIADLIEKKL